MSPATPRSKRRVHWVEDPQRIRVLSAPIRHELIDRLAAFGPMTVRDLAAALGRRPTSIYHHLRLMERAGLVRAARVTEEVGRPAQVYETVAPLIRLARAARQRRNHEPLAQAAAAAAQRAARDYAAGFTRDHWAFDGPHRNHWFFRVVASPSPARLARINALLDQLAELIWTPEPRPGPAVSIAWFLAPVATHPTRRVAPAKKARRHDPDRRLSRHRGNGQRSRARG